MPAVEVQVGSELSAEVRADVLDLADAASQVDRVSPLDDQVRIDLRHPSSATRHLTVTQDARVSAYGYLRLSDQGAESGHLVVAPDRRRHGLATAVVATMTRLADGRPLWIWSHGDLPGARAFAGRAGFRLVRQLWQMEGPLTDQIADPAYPDGVTVRTFEPGLDEAAWVEVNAAAFAGHAEQGAMTVTDLEQRMSEPWFDPGGFFLAERAGELLGFHWTKVHASPPGQDVPVGEVYVLGVSPTAQGLGLGSALTATGMRHLRARGMETVELYVEGDSAAAIRVYEKAGLRRSAVDVMYELD